ncbi:MAG: LacI family DNA-binding transcriptional regulator [Ruthenibacterium sp.]
MTIKDIAKESGYAVSTVSRALNDHPDVSAEAKRKIKAIIAHHGFVPNTNARQLKVQQSRVILILVKGAFNLFFTAIIERMQTAIADADYSAEVHYLDEEADEVLVGAQLQRERKPLGFIFLGGNVALFQRRFDTIHVPSVLATTVSADLTFPTLSMVGIDDADAGASACRYLLSKGHRHIGVIGGNPDNSYISALRYQGFTQAFSATGAAHDDSYYQKSSYSMDSGYAALQNLLARHSDITAVFCMSDLIAIGAMRAAHDSGLCVPTDLSILGFDGLSLGQFYTPKLASMRQPQAEIADRSVELLLAQIEKDAPARSIVLDTVLVEGESVYSL